MHAIPYGKQEITEKDIAAVTDALQGELLTQGPRITAFEEAFASYIGSQYAVAVSNGTAALHLSALALGVTSDKKVITTPITFAASANAVLYAGGQVDFCDINPQTYLLDLNRLEDMLKKDASQYQGVVPVDFAGYPVRTDELRQLCDRYGLWMLEDACHAPGGWFNDTFGKARQCGDGTFADLAIFSFHPVKHIAAGEGGMITTNSKALYDKLQLLRTHGITKSSELLQENHGGWYYEMQELGFNYRLTDIQAALGHSQLERAEENLEKRKKIAARYDAALKDVPDVATPFVAPGTGHAYHLYIIKTSQRKALYDFLRKHQIFTQVHYIPVHLQPYYQQMGWKKGDFPKAEQYYEQCLSLPMYPSLTEEEQEYVIGKIKAFYEE